MIVLQVDRAYGHLVSTVEDWRRFADMSRNGQLEFGFTLQHIKTVLSCFDIEIFFSNILTNVENM